MATMSQAICFPGHTLIAYTKSWLSLSFFFLSNVHTYNRTSLIGYIYHSKHKCTKSGPVSVWLCKVIIYFSNIHRTYELQCCNTKHMLPLSFFKAIFAALHFQMKQCLEENPENKRFYCY